MNTRTVEVLIFVLVCILIWRCEAAVNCKNAGRFPDPSDTACKNYTLCVYYAPNSTYIAYEYTCPTTSVFNPKSQKCTDPSIYKCEETRTTTDATTTDATTTDATTTEATEATTATDTPTSTNAPSNSDCSTAGRFPVTSDNTCQKYILCVYDSSKSSFVSYEYTCPTTSVFNPNSAQCTAPQNYECKQQDATTTTAPEVCDADGFIPDPSSTDCTGYFSCTVGLDPEPQTCPIGLFNPVTTNCETTYECPA